MYIENIKRIPADVKKLNIAQMTVLAVPKCAMHC